MSSVADKKNVQAFAGGSNGAGDTSRSGAVNEQARVILGGRTTGF